MKLQILYFSGAGATKLVAKQIYKLLRETANVALCPIEQAACVDLEQCDALVIGTPVHHASPAPQVLAYLDAIQPLSRAKPAFIYNTRAIYACNTNRILAKKLAEKNILTVLDKTYRSPASDGSLIVPFVQRFFKFEPGIRAKIHRDCAQFVRKLEEGDCRPYLPKFNPSSILNAPNKLAGQLITFPIHLHRERCILCGGCVARCPSGALEQDGAGYPQLIPGRCENCYRCIHHCPAKALSLSSRRAPDKLPYR